MAPARLTACLIFAGFLAPAHAAPAGFDPADPLLAVDRNRSAIVADIVKGFQAQIPSPDSDTPGETAQTLRKRLLSLRADRLLAASLASTYPSLLAILDESEATESAHMRSRAKAFGDAGRDLVYTPLTPCRLIDTRGFGAPIQGGAFAPNERRSYVPNGKCAIPQSGIASLFISFTTQNLTPGSGGYLAIVAPGAPISATVDVFNLGAEWSASNTAVATASAGQFDAFVANANAHLVVDVLGYFAPPPNGSVVTAQIADGAVTAAKLAASGCTSGQVLKFNGSFWACAGVLGCAAGDIQPCYSGPPGTLGVGVCKAGQRFCDAATGTFGFCNGQVLPSIEQPDGLDNNCNGIIDEPPSAPQVVDSSPSLDQAASVVAPVTATFSQPMDPATLNPATFTLAGPGGPVAGTVAYAGNIATFTPSARLAISSNYSATVTTGARDASGNPLAANFSFAFTTRPDEPVPVVAGCPTAFESARLRPLPFGSVKIVKMNSNDVTAYRIPASPSGRASVTLTQGQTASTPPSPTMDMTVSRCPGVIEPYLHPACRTTSTFINNMSITAFNRALPEFGWNTQEDLAPYGCLAPAATEQHYVNVRWSFSSCPFGVGGCGFSHQWAEGSF